MFLTFIRRARRVPVLRTFAVGLGIVWLPVVAAQAPPKPTEPTAPARPPRPATVLLHAVLPEMSIQDAPLDAAIESIARLLGTNIVVRWQELESVGVERQAPVTLQVKNLRVSQVLWLLLQQVQEDARLAWRVEDNLILISTAQNIGTEMVTRVYDVTDLIATRLRYPTAAFARVHQVPISVAPVVAEGAVGVQPVLGTFTSGLYLRGEDSGGEIYEPLFGAGAGASDEITPAEHLRELVDVITATVEPDSWDVNGGQGSVRAYRGMLVVRNTPFVHQMLGGPLSD